MTIACSISRQQLALNSFPVKQNNNFGANKGHGQTNLLADTRQVACGEKTSHYTTVRSFLYTHAYFLSFVILEQNLFAYQLNRV